MTLNTNTALICAFMPLRKLYLHIVVSMQLCLSVSDMPQRHLTKLITAPKTVS